ncbi:MAG: phage major capsid protein [Candidatus Omnitrophica bacterium]|nr:phage major capsid protein [Candidatus Omnitrophota bacterium]
MKKKPNLTSLKIAATSVRVAHIDLPAEGERIPVIFSSEVPVLERDAMGRPYFEIFDHSEENIDKSALRDGRLSLLESHMKDPMVVLGSVTDIAFPQDAPAGERIGRGFMEFSESQRGQDAEKDFLGEHRANVSVGATKIFPPLDITIDQKTGYPVVRFKWRPDEVSGVHEGADPNAAAFRSASDNRDEIIEVKINSTRGQQMKLTQEQLEAQEKKLREDQAELALKVEAHRKAKDEDPPGSGHKIDIGPDKMKAERTRIKDIDGLIDIAVESLGIEFKDIKEEAARIKAEGVPADQFRAVIMKKVGERKALDADDNALGMTDKEQVDFSLARAIRSMHAGDFNESSKEASYEYRVSVEAEKLQPNCISSQKTGERSLTLPVDIINSYARRNAVTPNDIAFVKAYLNSANGRAMRSMSVDQSTKGGAWTAEGLTRARFIDFLNAATITDRIGITQVPGLSGDLNFGVLDAIQDAYTRGEHEAATLSDLTTSTRKMSPRLVSAGTKISHLLKIQGAGMGIEAIIERKLALAQAIKRNKLFIYGTGQSGEPLGIAVNSGINVVAGGTDGLAPTLDNYINMRTLVMAANAGDLPGGMPIFLMNAVTVGKNQRTEITSGQVPRIMAHDTPPGQQKACIGHPVIESNLLRSNLTKGSGTNLSEAFFLNPAECYEGRWGTIRVVVDDKSDAATDETTTYIHEYVDYMLGHAVAVSYMNDLITT